MRPARTQTADSPYEVRHLDVAQLGSMLRQHRGSLSLRQAAESAGVSFSTFTRVESGSQPDLTSFTLLCAWLGVPPSQFFVSGAAREMEPIEEVISHLSSDPRLAPAAASRIADMLRSMYEALATSQQPGSVVACHLRAAAVMRPGVPERLNVMLGQMHAKLEQRIAAGEL